MSKNTQLGNLVNGLFVDSSGNVGVGTQSPSELLVLSKATYPTVKLIETTASAQGYFQYHSGNSYFILNAQSNHPLVFGTNDTERMRITSAGNVGIGTSSPSAKLHTNGTLRINNPSSSGQYMELYTSSAISYYNSQNNSAFYTAYQHIFNTDGTSATERMRITSDGKVIITLNQGSNNQFLNFVGTQSSYNQEYGFGIVNNTKDFRFYDYTAGVERMRITSAGNFSFGSTSASQSEINNNHNAVGQGLYWGTANNTSYADWIYNAKCERTNSSSYGFFRSISGGGDIEHLLRGDGNAYADASWNGGGADYAEYFEWNDGNANNEDRRGCSVSLTQGKIKVAESGEDIIGVVSSNPSVVGDAAWNKWEGKFLKDDFGSYLRDENDERILNPEYDESMEYIPREKRKEWEVIGLVGKLRIKKGQEINSSWIKIKDISSEVEEWLVK